MERRRYEIGVKRPYLIGQKIVEKTAQMLCDFIKRV
jgi:hypothetical protein